MLLRHVPFFFLSAVGGIQALEVPFAGWSKYERATPATLPTWDTPPATSNGDIAVEHGSLTTNGRQNPLGIGDTKPTFKWRLTSSNRNTVQYAYQILAANSPDALTAGHAGLLWDSGTVKSNDAMANWAGSDLGSRALVYWTVRSWASSDGKPSAWAAPAWFEIALLKRSDWQAKWITNLNYVNPTGLLTTNVSLPYYAKDFNIGCSAIKSARLYISGLGQQRSYINGRDISTSNLLSPGYTVFNVTVEYATYNVTQLLKKGDNTLAVLLGKGGYDFEWYRPDSNFGVPPDSNGALNGRYTMFGGVGYVQALVIAQLEYECADAKEMTYVASGTDWKTSLSGPLLESAWLGGEAYDARREFNGWNNVNFKRSSPDWYNASLWTTGGPADSVLMPQIRPDLSIVETLEPVSITSRDGGDWIVDFGENIVGWYSIHMKGKTGDYVEIWPQDYKMIDGNISTFFPKQIVFDSYVFAGTDEYKGTESYSPQTSYWGFQWLRIKYLKEKPALSDLRAYRIRTAAETIGNFSTSNSLINGISTIVRKAAEGNFYSTLTDCPHREKTAWLEDQHLAYDAYGNYFDMEAIGSNIGRSVRDQQSVYPDHRVPTTAPRYMAQSGTHDNDPNWGSNIIMFQWQLYLDYGTRSILEVGYEPAARYIDYLKSKTNGTYLLNFGMGDWAAADASTPVELAVTYALQRTVQVMAMWAAELGKADESKAYLEYHGKVLDAINANLFNSSIGTYGSGSITSCAVGIATGAGASRGDLAGQRKALKAALEKSGNHTTSGEVGLRAMIDALMTYPEGDEYLWALATSETYPSWGYIVKQGHTTMTEDWHGNNFSLTNNYPGSQNHFMLGTIERWFGKGLAGVDHGQDDYAYKNITIDPYLPPAGLTWVKRSYRTQMGYLIVEWKFDQSRAEMSLNVQIPVGTTATVTLRGAKSNMKLDGASDIASQKGVKKVGNGDNATVYVTIGSGRYMFTSKPRG